MKTDNMVILELSEYDQQMMILALLTAWKADSPRELEHVGLSDYGQQMRDWVKQKLLALDPSYANRELAFDYHGRS